MLSRASSVLETATGVPRSTLEASWDHSALALAWVRQGSINRVLGYAVQLDGPCLRAADTSATCLAIIANLTVAFRAPLLASFAKDLTIGSLYRARVAAANLNGTSPPATLLQRLAGPPSFPAMLSTQAVGALQVLVTWLLPTNTGDLTTSVGIDAYTLDVLASPGEAPLLLTLPTEARALTGRLAMSSSYVSGLAMSQPIRAIQYVEPAPKLLTFPTESRALTGHNKQRPPLGPP